MDPFRSTPATDLADPAARRALRSALEAVEARLGRSYPLLIGGDEVAGGEGVASSNPASPAQLVGRVTRAAPADVDRAVEAARAGFDAWRRTGPEERTALLLRAAELMRERRFELAAWNVLETGKTWREADGEIAETIDLLEYYPRQLLRLHARAESALEPHPREENSYRYLPLGVGAVITPWPFPTAQPVGIAGAALVTGNAVVVKPGSASPVLTHQVMRLFLEAGAPPGVVNVLAGSGAEVGAALVRHPLTRFIGFTGSKEVGRRVFADAARPDPDQRWLKRTVLEMAGKNAVVVDETADLDAAADAIVASAFSFQGQKCSAGSRAIVVREVYDALLEAVAARTAALRLGDPADFATEVGPLIDDAARRRVLDYLEVGKREGRLIVGGAVPDRDGYFLEPAVIADVAPDARVAREEILGPVLAVIGARDVDDALAIANDTEYGLTGSFFSTSPERLDRAIRDFHVGSLYLNRKSVGSEVGVHPFGGFNMSGTDAKAGGPDYLPLFVQAQTVSRRVG